MVTFMLLGLMSLAVYGLPWPGQEKPEQEIKLAGHIEATETDLAFQVPGRIEAIFFHEGQEVKAGLAVAKLEDKVFRHEVDAAEGRLEAVDVATRPKKLKDAELKQARAAVELARLRLSYATLISPVSGLVPGEVSQSLRSGCGGRHHHHPG